jgi:hypothetical protein
MGSLSSLSIGHVIVMLMMLGMVVGYFIPSVIAYKREHHNKAAIICINLLLGWTFVGWVASLAWSLTAVSNGSKS